MDNLEKIKFIIDTFLDLNYKLCIIIQIKLLKSYIVLITITKRLEIDKVFVLITIKIYYIVRKLKIILKYVLIFYSNLNIINLLKNY